MVLLLAYPENQACPPALGSLPPTHPMPRIFPGRLPGILAGGESYLPVLSLGPHPATRLAQRGPLVHNWWLPQGPGRFLQVFAGWQAVRPVDKTGWGAMAVCPAIGSYPHMPTEDRMPSISEGRDHRPPPARKGKTCTSFLSQ